MNTVIKIYSCVLYHLFNTYLILSGREHIPWGCNTATETSVRRSVVHSWGSKQSVNTWYTFSWMCIPMLPWKRGFAGLYNSFESMSVLDILFRSLSLHYYYPCIIHLHYSLVSQVETVWGFIFHFCQFCCVWKAVFPFSLTYNIILWERDEDRVSLAILVFTPKASTSQKWKMPSFLEETQFISQNRNTNEAKPTASNTPCICELPSSITSRAQASKNDRSWCHKGGVSLLQRQINSSRSNKYIFLNPNSYRSGKIKPKVTTAQKNCIENISSFKTLQKMLLADSSGPSLTTCSLFWSKIWV